MKKKFKLALENDMKPDISSAFKQAEAEFSQYASEIFNGVAIQDDPAFDLQDLYKEQKSAEPALPADIESFLEIVEQARLDAIAMSVGIFNEKTLE